MLGIGHLPTPAAVYLVGLVIAIVIGVVWAVAMNLAKWVERTTFPYAVILQSIPILAVVPLIGFWFGYDFIARTIVCVLIALFPIVSNTLFGLQSGGRTESILLSMPPMVSWSYQRQDAPDSPEAALLRDFLVRKDWLAAAR